MRKRVDKTHPGLGNLVALELVAVTAKRCFLCVSPAGCGKSVAAEAILRLYPRERKHHIIKLTKAGLRKWNDLFSYFDGLVVMDDLGAIDTLYSQMTTLTTMAYLVYSHNYRATAVGEDINIRDFFGSCILNVQPIWMPNMVYHSGWTAMVQDKVLRYYHLIRPKEPAHGAPVLDIDRVPSIQDVTGVELRGKKWIDLLRIGLIQWSYARCKEHIPALLRACAALDDRTEVNSTDYSTLLKLMSNMRLERYLLDRYEFESALRFKHNEMCILTELASFNHLNIATICTDFKVSPSTAHRLLNNVSDWCTVVKGRIVPTDLAMDVLETIGIRKFKRKKKDGDQDGKAGVPAEQG
ncbi:MAG: hypothetical protein JRD89_06135 [Deltaproteobacteria bacterium]|nr:hypothetical protein [Deltaproteobacteria bacterium]